MVLPLAKKLQIKEGQRGFVFQAPEGFIEALELPADAEVTTSRVRGKLDFAVAFVTDRAEVAKHGVRCAGAVERDGLLWFAYPKQASGIKTDINRDRGWEPLKSAGLRPVRQIAIDDTWSALRFRPADLVGG